MAEKDDDFLDGEEAAAEGKEGGKPKGRFASAMILQILKWVAIILGGIVFIVTVVVITINVMGVGQQTNERIEESPEYENVVPVLSWFPNIGELRGVTADDERHTFVITPQLGYTDGDAGVQNELVTKQIQLTDMLLTWFSSQKFRYLLDIRNREEIRETIRAEINKMISKPIKDVRFTTFQVLDF